MIDIDKLRELANRLGRDRTHWEGCQYEHPECAIWSAAREIDGLRDTMDMIQREMQLEIDNLRDELSSGWTPNAGINSVIVHPLDIIEAKVGTIVFGPRPEREVCLKRRTADYYRHVTDEIGIPYVQDDGGFPDWAKYVATERNGDAHCYSVRPFPNYCPVLWDLPENDWFMKLDKKYSNTLVAWDESLRRIWRAGR